MREVIDNRTALCDHGRREAREVLCDIASEAIGAVHPDRTVPRHLEREGDELRIDDRTHDIADRDVYVLGVGKGAAAVVARVADVLGDYLTAGIVVDKHGQGEETAGTDRVETYTAAHPVPDEAGAQAAERVREWARERDESDLVIACITGGASALLPAPTGEVTLGELSEVTDTMLGAGAPIEDINVVRRHLSAVKGGRLTALFDPATVVTLVVIDEVAGEPWGPTVPDATTFDEAIDALRRHDCWSDAPDTVRRHLLAGADDEVTETPTAAEFERFDTQVVSLADADNCCAAAVEAAEARGYDGLLLSTTVEGESRDVGTAFAAIATEAARSGQPADPPCVLVSGGETTVTLDGDEVGEGGPNQEFALSAAQRIDGEPVAALALGTDGTDGPTDLAGGLVDGETLASARERDVNIHDALARHDAAPALRELGDAVVTGGTGTNVMDLRLFLVD